MSADILKRERNIDIIAEQISSRRESQQSSNRPAFGRRNKSELNRDRPKDIKDRDNSDADDQKHQEGLNFSNPEIEYMLRDHISGEQNVGDRESELSHRLRSHAEEVQWASENMASVQNSSRRGKKPRADGTPVSDEVMDALGVDYDRFDEKSNVQVFIDRHHRVVESDHVASESEPDELQGSEHSIMDEQTRNIKAMCAVLLKD